jgi:hypothetical protein
MKHSLPLHTFERILTAMNLRTQPQIVKTNMRAARPLSTHIRNETIHGLFRHMASQESIRSGPRTHIPGSLVWSKRGYKELGGLAFTCLIDSNTLESIEISRHEPYQESLGWEILKILSKGISELLPE